jgi:3',5'-cyclic AMP phosphodiesterase CpdA
MVAALLSIGRLPEMISGRCARRRITARWGIGLWATGERTAGTMKPAERGASCCRSLEPAGPQAAVATRGRGRISFGIDDEFPWRRYRPLRYDEGDARVSPGRFDVTRRHWTWCCAATAFLVAGLVVLITEVYPWARWTEDFFPGTPPDLELEAEAWETTGDFVRFAVVGDTGTGGRNEMAVAGEMAETYRGSPYGLVIHVGDISYYGSVADRWHDVFVEPFRPLLEAGVRFEVAVGNHELEEEPSAEADAEIVAVLERIGAIGRYYVASHGPVDFFIIDSSTPQINGVDARAQLKWLDRALTESTARWKVAVLHHPPYASGPKRGSNLHVREALEPLFIEHGVDLVLTGHDHFYERSKPQHGITYVVSGAGAKLSPTGTGESTAVAARELQFMLIEVDGGTLHARSMGVDGQTIDEFSIVKEHP